MKSSTKLVVAAKNIGRPHDSLEHEGTVASCIKSLAAWLLEADMGSRIDVSFGRTLADVQVVARRGGDKASILASIDEMFSLPDFQDDESPGEGESALQAAAE